MKPQNQLQFVFRSAILLVCIAGLSGAVISQTGQKSSKIFFHDTTKSSNGGENATQGLRNQLASTLEREKPCVEVLNDQDLRDAIDDERERELLEGANDDAALRAIGTRFNARLVMAVQALPGPGGGMIFSAFVIDTVANKTVSRRLGSQEEVADGVYHDISSSLADNCKPHWIGTVKWVYSFKETKTSEDEGAAHAARRNVKRTNSQTSTIETRIIASLNEPATAAETNSPKAMVVHKTLFDVVKSSQTSGEQRCREPGRNPYFKGFNEEYSESVLQIGRATDMTPVKIEIASDGKYTVRIVAPEGKIIGKIETKSSHATCDTPQPKPELDVRETPESSLQSTSVSVEGKTDPKNPSSLTGTKTSPDGRITTTWNLRLVKPKGK